MPDSIGPTSASLLVRVQQLDGSAWQRLSKLYGPLVYHWSRRCGLSAEDSADIVQEVFGVLARRIRDFRAEQGGGSFRGWLWTIARNKVRDQLRRSAGRAVASGGSEAYQSLQQLADGAPEPWADDQERSTVDHGLTMRALEQVRAEFETKTWQAFWHAAVEGKTAAEISLQLGMTRHAVHQAKYRVLRRLRQELDGLA